jgi:hypothetical protein
MLDQFAPFLTPSYLRSVWDAEFQAYLDSGNDAALLERLRNWSAKADLGEVSAQTAFVQSFFVELWGYRESGATSGTSHTLYPQYAVPGAGDAGGTGLADLAMGHFEGAVGIPQVLCEYKGTGTNLDADQRRKGSRRSPTRQALDYLSHARRGFMGSEPVLPLWAIVSNMNEFRLYWYDRGASESLRFVIAPRDLLDGEGLLADSETARFARFTFAKVFHADTLLTSGGRPELLRLIQDQRVRNRQIEETFYQEYRAYRTTLYNALLDHNGPGTPRFPGSKGRLVRLAQKLLDRLLFVAYCDDMGHRLAYPPKQLRDIFVSESNNSYFDAQDDSVWRAVKRLFASMNTGAPFAGRPMHRFNGGLFAEDPTLDALFIPNRVFCLPRQGQNEASIRGAPLTALYLIATYNYAADLAGNQERSLGLYTLGRIFEQSITELEILEAEADDRLSLNQVSGRKRDGVYYTPEWVVELIVGETFQPLFVAMKRAAGWDPDADAPPSAQAVDAYMQALRDFTVCDPACGSGAFLVTALRHLRAEWLSVRRLRASLPGQWEPEGDAALTERLLRHNLFGIDINPASAEITQLALWLHTARRDAPLSDLGDSIRCGNSLVTETFYDGHDRALFPVERLERINAFDWREAFPQVAARGGFDAVIGNPPYVKLQNFRQVFPEVATYLAEGSATSPAPFRSTSTGNFDLYLPFVEQGLRMLRPGGRLGYIAPNIWAVAEYGHALRDLVMRSRQLEAWLDFGSYQVFEEATTYTALQFFNREPSAGVRVARAPDGVITRTTLTADTPRLGWQKLAYGDRWLMLGGPERDLLDRLARDCLRLGDRNITSHVFVGVQTSADEVYHLERLGPNRYRAAPSARMLPGFGNGRPQPFEVEIEDAVMRPLVSGAEAKRYVAPATETWLLFPYEMIGTTAQLISPTEMAARYPRAWAYLQRFETALRRREARQDEHGNWIGPVNNADWHAYVYQKNHDKLHLPKLIVAQTVPRMRVCFDNEGAFALNNVRVNGILAEEPNRLWFLMGVLNGRVADYVFRRIARPKDRGYFEANKQFIEPLPIPRASPQEQADVAERARRLQALHTQRRDALRAIARRVSAAAGRPRAPGWLFAGLPPVEAWQARAPAGLNAADRTRWAREQHARALAERDRELREAVEGPGDLTADLVAGELRLLRGGRVVLDRVFPTSEEAPFLLAQWQALLAELQITGRLTGRRLSEKLRSFASSDNPGLVQQVLEQAALLDAATQSIRQEEAAMEEVLARLYRLSDAERRLVEAG